MLGSLEVRAASGEALEIGGARLRALLMMLALRPGQLVPASQLIDGLWADQAPAGAANALQALVSRLRRALPEALIESRPAGYQLKLDPGRSIPSSARVWSNRLTSPSVTIEYVMPPCWDEPLTAHPDPADAP